MERGAVWRGEFRHGKARVFLKPDDMSERPTCKWCGRNLGIREGAGEVECWRCRTEGGHVYTMEGELVKIGAAFSDYLKQDDIGDKRVTVTMDRVEVDEVGSDDKPEKKPVLYFRGKDKGLILNRTNAQSISEIVGSDETDHWKGHQIVLYVDPSVMYAGRKVGGVRVTAPAAGGQVRPVPPPLPSVAPFQASDEDVPFSALLPVILPLLCLIA